MTTVARVGFQATRGHFATVLTLLHSPVWQSHPTLRDLKGKGKELLLSEGGGVLNSETWRFPTH